MFLFSRRDIIQAYHVLKGDFMKKLTIFLLLLSVFLVGCTANDTPSSSQNNISSENAAVEPQSTAQPGYVASHLSTYTIDRLLNVEKRQSLNNSMITAVISSTKMLENDTADIGVTFSKNGINFLTVHTVCDIYYLRNGAWSEYVTVSGLNASVQDNMLIVTTYDKVSIYSVESYQNLLTIQPTDTSRKLIDTAVYKDGWISAFVSETQQGFEVYDKNGNFIKDYIFDQPLFTVSAYSNYNSDSALNPRPHIKFMDMDQQHIVYIADQSFYGLASANYNQPPHFLFDLVKESVIDFDLLHHGNLYPYNNSLEYFLISANNNDSLQLFTVKDSKPYKTVRIKKSLLPDGFASEELHTRSNEYSIDNLCLYCDVTNTLITVNTNSGDVYTLPASTVEKYSLSYMNETTPDGKYSIYSGASHGGGDISYAKYYLVENATGKVKYIDELGGMYGGKEDTGFLQNNDVYVYTYEDFVIFDTDMSNSTPIYRLTDYFPMGDKPIDGVNYRYLMAARRDPVSKSVLIIYWDDLYDDEHYEDRFIDYQNNGWQLKATYKVALINPDGTIGYIHDTGVNVLANFGLRPVSMYLESGDSLRIYSWANSHRYTYFEGRLNLTTGEYQSIKDFDLSLYQY